ncbi:hypothetical protein LLG10_05190 [bacterium]|nr:hypothetical protein [bacterium]
MNRIINDSNWSYEYDTYGQLTKAYRGETKECKYEYDIAGNRTKKVLKDGLISNTWTYEYDDMKRITKINNPNSSISNYYYNLPDHQSIHAMLGPTKIVNKIGDTVQNTTIYEYNPLAFPKSIASFDGDNNPIGSVTMEYDPVGNRTKMGDRSFYYYDGLPISEFREGNPTITTDDVLLNYTFYGTNPLLMQVNPVPGVSNIPFSNELFYTDHLGSVIGTTDDPTLNLPLKSRTGYLPFGEIESSQGTSFNPLKYAGTYYEPTSSSYASPPVDQMYSMGTRLYDSSIGRFPSADIWGPANLTDPWAIHSYHYCGNDPVNNIDPFGMKESCLDKQNKLFQYRDLLINAQKTMADAIKQSNKSQWGAIYRCAGGALTFLGNLFISAFYPIAASALLKTFGFFLAACILRAVCRFRKFRRV